jgi:hypothetical protein
MMWRFSILDVQLERHHFRARQVLERAETELGEAQP